jgi:hypothetical protein
MPLHFNHWLVWLAFFFFSKKIIKAKIFLSFSYFCFVFFPSHLYYDYSIFILCILFYTSLLVLFARYLCRRQANELVLLIYYKTVLWYYKYLTNLQPCRYEYTVYIHLSQDTWQSCSSYNKVLYIHTNGYISLFTKTSSILLWCHVQL